MDKTVTNEFGYTSIYVNLIHNTIINAIDIYG